MPPLYTFVTRSRSAGRFTPEELVTQFPARPAHALRIATAPIVRWMVRRRPSGCVPDLRRRETSQTANQPEKQGLIAPGLVSIAECWLPRQVTVLFIALGVRAGPALTAAAARSKACVAWGRQYAMADLVEQVAVVLRNLAFSRPWPRRMSCGVNHAPLFPRLPTDGEVEQAPAVEMPSSNMMSNSASRNGGGDLVLDHAAARGCRRLTSPSFDGAGTADVDADRGVELERVRRASSQANRTSRRSSRGSG